MSISFGYSRLSLLAIMTLFTAAVVLGQARRQVTPFGFRKGMTKTEVALRCKCQLKESSYSSYPLNDPKYGSDSRFFYQVSVPGSDPDFQTMIVGIHPQRGLMFIEAVGHTSYISDEAPNKGLFDQEKLVRVSKELEALYGPPDYFVGQPSHGLVSDDSRRETMKIKFNSILRWNVDSSGFNKYVFEKHGYNVESSDAEVEKWEEVSGPTKNSTSSNANRGVRIVLRFGMDDDLLMTSSDETVTAETALIVDFTFSGWSDFLITAANHHSLSD